MLFGSKKFQESFMQDVMQVAKQKGFNIVFGSLIGSLPQGIQCYDSDYDSVFLYINDDFPDQIVDADVSEYDEVLYRYYPDDPLCVYDSLTFREFTSFLGFLENPSIHHENRDYGLYYYFADVLFSPYTWDPHGIQMKILPFIHKCYNHLYMVRAFVNKIKLVEKNCEIGKSKRYNYKFYIRKFLYTFYLEWVLRFKEFAPTYMETVLLNSQYPKEAQELRILLERYRIEDINNYRDTKVSIIKEAHLSLEIEENKVLEDYLKRILEQAEMWLLENENYNLNKENIRKNIINMVDVTQHAIHEEIVKDVSIIG